MIDEKIKSMSPKLNPICPDGLLFLKGPVSLDLTAKDGRSILEISSSQ